MNKISVGIDIHGVLDTYYNILKPIMKMLIDNEHDVHIVTGIPFNKIEYLFKKIDIQREIHFNHYFSIETSLLNKGYSYNVINGEKYFYTDIWNSEKSKYCTKHNISLMIDDTEAYGIYFETPFVCIK